VKKKLILRKYFVRNNFLGETYFPPIPIFHYFIPFPNLFRTHNNEHSVVTGIDVVVINILTQDDITLPCHHVSVFCNNVSSEFEWIILPFSDTSQFAVSF